jgi:hypothetical protein
MADLDEFTRAYIAAALWSSNDESTPQGGEPLDANYSVDDIAPETMEKIIADCAKFQADNAADLAIGPSLALRECTPLEYAGHDFWLTRNHHGCGFWDGDWPEAVGERLTEAAQKFGEVDLYVGDDGKLYI